MKFLFFFLFCGFVFVDSCAVKPCKIKCCKNEIYMKCGGCDGTCANHYPCCDEKGPPGCYCKKGYVRDACGHCIKICQCPKCKNPHEEWRCDNCDPTLKHPVKDCCCACRWGCFCKEGYFRNCNCECVPRHIALEHKKVESIEQPHGHHEEAVAIAVA